MTQVDYEKLAEIGVYVFFVAVNTPWFSGTLKVKSEEDAICLGRMLARVGEENHYEYRVTAYENVFGRGVRWIHEWDYSKQRVAPPNHHVFVVAWSRDCDGISGFDLESFTGLQEAAEWFDGWCESLEGPSAYSTVSREEWESFERPPFRDPYAEAAGY